MVQFHCASVTLDSGTRCDLGNTAVRETHWTPLAADPKILGMPIPLTFDVTAGVGTGEHLTQAGWAFLPPRPADAVGTLLCLPGGLYDKRYWHMQIDGHPGYSFAEHLAAAGFIVIAVDHLGVGESADPTASGQLGLSLLASGDAEVARQVREGLRNGDLIGNVPPLAVPLIGVGHSMGACLTTMVQANTGVYDAVALLGYGVQITNVFEESADADDLENRVQQSIAAVCQLSGASPQDSHHIAPRSYLEDLFYAGEVPRQVIDADTAAQSRLPLRAGAEVATPGFVERHAPQVDVPVLLAFGAAIDVSPNPYCEPANYTGSADVTLLLVSKSGHCQNFASHRQQLWDRIAAWVPAAT
ncbi:alpha/beta hydrolase [Mycolicibacterium vanbaalenii]|uniref:alpha/beta hydrolase n=1 Tax=Mycolicibacterium vanbaalenii TaxID=110539 RepID=UPI001F36B6FA|nr:alpha/beta fold hydrolase [Mycolicibacterium vanbaalenii]